MRPLIRLGDAAFTAGWLGVLAFVGILDLAVLSGISSKARQDELLEVAAKIFWPTVAVWLVLATWMIIDCVRARRLNREERRTWLLTMVLNVVIVGPTAYYLASYRSVRDRPRVFITANCRLRLDILYVSSFWGSLGCLGLFFGALVLPLAPTTWMTVITLGLAIIPFAVIATIVLFSLLLIDAVARSTESRTGREYLRLLNPWSWIFGLRRYYLGVLRPTLT